MVEGEGLANKVADWQRVAEKEARGGKLDNKDK